MNIVHTLKEYILVFYVLILSSLLFYYHLDTATSHQVFVFFSYVILFGLYLSNVIFLENKFFMVLLPVMPLAWFSKDFFYLICDSNKMVLLPSSIVWYISIITAFFVVYY